MNICKPLPWVANIKAPENPYGHKRIAPMSEQPQDVMDGLKEQLEKAKFEILNPMLAEIVTLRVGWRKEKKFFFLYNANLIKKNGTHT